MHQQNSAKLEISQTDLYLQQRCQPWLPSGVSDPSFCFSSQIFAGCRSSLGPARVLIPGEPRCCLGTSPVPDPGIPGARMAAPPEHCWTSSMALHQPRSAHVGSGAGTSQEATAKLQRYSGAREIPRQTWEGSQPGQNSVRQAVLAVPFGGGAFCFVHIEGCGRWAESLPSLQRGRCCVPRA